MATNVFDLFAKISLDTKEYEKGLGDAKNKFSDFASGIGKIAGKIGDVLANIAKGAAVAVGAASTAIAGLAKQSLDAYATFEQLEGGTKLMFGEAADYIIQKSEEAYKTVQLSQNEYLQQVNGFAVGLKTALGGNEQAAAELADKIVQAEADIVAATGNTQEMVQNAFNGIMRNNYTMLDNLGLGIKPTKEGMEEVIATVNEWNAAHGKATSYVIDNLADVQAALVDYVEMQGMAGYASMEAGSTITGSLAGVKAAWQNFLTGNGSITDFTDMLIPTVKNLREKLQKLLPNLMKGLRELIEILAPEIPSLIEETLPTIIRSAAILINGISDNLPELLTAILPALTEAVVDVTVALIQVLPQLITSLQEAAPIVVQTIMSKKDELIQAGKDIISTLFPSDLSKVTEITTSAVSMVTEFAAKVTNPENIKKVFDVGISIINSIVDGLLSDDSINAFIEAVPLILQNLAESITYILGGEDGKGGLMGAAENIIEKLTEYFSDEENRKKFEDAAVDMLITMGNFLVENTWRLAEFVVRIGQDLAGMIIQAFADNFISLFDSEYGMMDEYMKADTNLSYDQWLSEKQESDRRANTTSQSYVDSGYLIAGGAGGSAAQAAYYKAMGLHGYATGGVFNRPSIIQVGEDGAEAVVPLEKNTGWIDELASKISSRGASFGDITINVYAPSGDADDISNSMIAAIDENLRNRELAQIRGVGGVAWT